MEKDYIVKEKYWRDDTGNVWREIKIIPWLQKNSGKEYGQVGDAWKPKRLQSLILALKKELTNNG